MVHEHATRHRYIVVEKGAFDKPELGREHSRLRFMSVNRRLSVSGQRLSLRHARRVSRSTNSKRFVSGTFLLLRTIVVSWLSECIR